MPKRPTSQDDPRPVSLKTLAKYLDLSPATVSFVLNDAPNRSIPETTRERVRAAARKFNYQPSIIARSLQGKRTQTVGLLVSDLGAGDQTQILSSAADVLMRAGYFYFTAQHKHEPELVEQYPRTLSARGVEGFLTIDTTLAVALPWPTVAVSGCGQLENVTNVVVDYARAAELTLTHLTKLGHRCIAFLRGAPSACDADARWAALMASAAAHACPVDEGLVLQMQSGERSAESFTLVKTLLESRRDFTAVVCFDDLSAIGCIRALHDAGLHVPADVSVMGFDDITGAAFHVPSLTTIRQPLREMGKIAAETLLAKIAKKAEEAVVALQPELVVRESTAQARV